MIDELEVGDIIFLDTPSTGLVKWQISNITEDRVELTSLVPTEGIVTSIHKDSLDAVLAIDKWDLIKSDNPDRPDGWW